MIIKPMIRNNICMNAHPMGCLREVQDQIAYVKGQGAIDGPKKVLVVGSSTGFGLATRISAAFGSGASTLGISFEKEASEKRPGTMGWYNTQAFQLEAQKEGLYAEDINGDAFSHEMKTQVVEKIKADLGKIDLFVYSLASPVRTDPNSGEMYRSVLKPIGQSYTAKSINVQTAEVSQASFDAANEDEINQTVKVMGGEDWELWTKALLDGGVLENGAKVIAYSYIGPEVTRPVYRDGTIGKAKEHLETSAAGIHEMLKSIDGHAYVSVNKALVTRASAVIPVVPLYLALLFKVMKAKDIHENCIHQMYRLLKDKLYVSQVPLDEKGRIRMDDWELREDVQAEVNGLWPQVSTDNVQKLGDLDEYSKNFLHIHGFGKDGVDYEADVSPILENNL